MTLAAHERPAAGEPPVGPRARAGTSPLRRLALPAAVAGVAAVGVAVLATVDPHEAGHYPTCPFLWMTGLYCPGCGSLRAIHDLAHLDVAGAWSMNPLLVLVAPFLLGAWFAWAWRVVSGRTRRRVAPVWAIWSLLALLAAYWVARNVPALEPWLAP